MDFYPEEIQCVDSVLKNYNRHGIADYWDARVYSNFSKIGLKIDAVGALLIPFNSIGNTKQFRNSYSYIIIIFFTLCLYNSYRYFYIFYR